ncbi:MAG: biopolymer transporter ExbD [Candidatus Rokubacteria bacterium]|nr:biopolymer transporter ExbD [Candidatus Rokubacteria bacterium]
MAIRVDAGADGGTRVRSSLAEINVIPLVDVVLVLLLIFMLTAPMMYRGIDVNLPKTASKPTAIEERLVLTITKDRLLFLNDRALPLVTLEPRLREFFRDRADKTLFIKADKDLAYGYVVETMDRVRRAGIERVGMVTEPLPKRE